MTSTPSLVIDIGCGSYKTDGAIGVDAVVGGEEDIQHDLNVFPYPFEESSVDVVYANHILEHVDDFIGVMHELYRVCKPGAKIYVRTPHASCLSSTWADPTHKRFFVKHSFLHFAGENKKIYGFKTDIVVKSVRLHYYLYNGFRKGKRLGNKPLILNTVVNAVANSSGRCKKFLSDSCVTILADSKRSIMNSKSGNEDRP